MKKIYSRGWRVRKAYWTAFVVVMSYFRLWLVSKLRGKKYYEKRITVLHIKNANRVKDAILQLQGLFIKVGQLLSILTNFLPEAFQAPLEALQDQMPPRPYSEIKIRIEKELGKPIAELFPYFEKEPIASASIGQAHKAKLPDGTVVVVKVQHWNIEKVAQIDLEIIRRLVLLSEWFMDIKGMDYAYTQVRKMIEEELDFKQEASSMQIIGKNLEEIEGIAVPQIHLEYSADRVLTSTFMEGVKISNVAQLKEWDLEGRTIANRLIHAYCKMVLKDGFYHADPHPGNILVQKDGTIVLLDFGAVATLNPAMQEGIPNLIEAAIKNDTDTMIEVLRSMEFLAYGKDAEEAAEKIITALRNFLQNEIQFDGLNFKDIKVNPFETSLFNLLQDVGFKGIASTIQVPKDWVLLNRMMTLLLGIFTTLDDQMNPLDVVRPYVQEYILGGKGNYINFVKELLQGTITNALALPDDMRKVLKKANKGDLEFQIKGVQEQSMLQYLLGQQLIYALLAIASFTFSYLFHQSNEPDFAQYGLGIGGLFLLLIVRANRQARPFKFKK